MRIPVHGGLEQSVITPQARHLRVVAELAQHQFRLRPGGADALEGMQVMGSAGALQQTGEVVQDFGQRVAE